LSKISLQPNASGTGTFTLAAPDSNTNRTLTLPDEAGSVLTDVSDLAAANLTGDVAADRITGALNATGSAPIYACRAWVNFDGTGTVSIRASGNVSSITDNGTGDYTVNFATAIQDADYCVVGSIRSESSTFGRRGFLIGFSNSSKTNTSINCVTTDEINPPEVSIAFFR